MSLSSAGSPELTQMAAFTNRVIIALSNALPPFFYSDPTQTTDNPGTVVAISSISVDSFGVVTIQTSAAHGVQTTTASIVVAAVSPSVYNGCFQVINIPDTTHLKVRNLAAIGSGAGSGGNVTVTVQPIYNTFQPQFPTWTASASYALNSAVIPVTPNGFYFTVIAPAQGGQSAATEPTWPTTVGATVQDGNITWQNAGATSSAAPPPPGCAHLIVYASCLWAFNTSPLNTSNGLDGPTVLRMSDVNNPLSWNPVNVAFLDKDDGTVGMGLATYTVTAQGIPPQGSLVACKLEATYQIIGVFGASNFAIQRISTDLGCISPRTLLFVPGFGIGRVTHLGVAIFDGVNDKLISPQIEPYLFPQSDPEIGDITPMDASQQYFCRSGLTAIPPMYCTAIPVGISGGWLTRILCFDLVLKAWVVIDLPFPIGSIVQARSASANAVTVLGSYLDGTLQRWQSADIQWATSVAGSAASAPVAYSMRSPTVASKSPDERLYGRRYWVRGQVGAQSPSAMAINPRAHGVALGSQSTYLPPSGQYTAEAAIQVTSDLFDATISGTGPVTIDACGAHVSPKPLGKLEGQLV